MYRNTFDGIELLKLFLSNKVQHKSCDIFLRFFFLLTANKITALCRTTSHTFRLSCHKYKTSKQKENIEEDPSVNFTQTRKKYFFSCLIYCFLYVIKVEEREREKNGIFLLAAWILRNFVYLEEPHLAVMLESFSC